MTTRSNFNFLVVFPIVLFFATKVIQPLSVHAADSKLTQADPDGGTGVKVNARMPETSATPAPTPTFTPSPIPTPVFEPEPSAPLPSEPVSNVLTTNPFQLAATPLLSGPFGLLIQILIRVLQLLGMLALVKRIGMVFDSQTEKPVSFATVYLQSVEHPEIAGTLITNAKGEYGEMQLSAGTYQIEVRHNDYRFPSIQDKPFYLSLREFYKGEKFLIQDSFQNERFIIPVDLKKTIERRHHQKFYLRPTLYRIFWLANLLVIPLFIISTGILFLFPTILNAVVWLVYVYLIISRLAKRFRMPRIQGLVTDDTGRPLENVFVRINDPENSQILCLLMTDGNGEFSAILPKGLYVLSLAKADYIWEESLKIQGVYTVDAQKSRVGLVTVMRSVRQVYQEQFGAEFSV